MDWVNAAYNKLEGFAIAADRVLGAIVGRCEDWKASRRAESISIEGQYGDKPRAVAVGHNGDRPERSLSA